MMIDAALDRAVRLFLENTGEELSRALRPPAGADEVATLAAATGLDLHPDLLSWFGRHNGGNAPGPLHWQLLSLSESLEHRTGLLNQMGGSPDVEGWVPFMVDSVETYIVDSVNGQVLHHDLVDGLHEIAPSLAAWVDSEMRRCFHAEDLDNAEPTRRRLEMPQPTSDKSPSGVVLLNRATGTKDDRTDTAHSPTRVWSPPTGGIIAAGSAEDGSMVIAVEADGWVSLVRMAPGGAGDASIGSYPIESGIPRDRLDPTGSVATFGRAVLDVAAGGGEVLPAVWLGSGAVRNASMFDASLTFGAQLVIKGAFNDSFVVVDEGIVRPEPPQRRVGRFFITPEWDHIRYQSVDGSADFTITREQLDLETVFNATFAESPDGTLGIFATGEGAVVTVDFSTGSVRRVSDPVGEKKVVAIAKDNSFVLAYNRGWPTSELVLLRLDGSGSLPLGLPHDEEANAGTLSPNGRFFAHHARKAEHQLVVEVIDLSDRTSTAIATTKTNLSSIGHTIDHGPGYITFRDGSARGKVGLFAAATGPNGLQEPVRLAAGKHTGDQPVKFSSLGPSAVWRDGSTLRWSRLDGSSLGHLAIGEPVSGWGVDSNGNVFAVQEDKLVIVSLNL